MKFSTGSISFVVLAVAMSTTACEHGARVAAEQRADSAEARLTKMDAITSTKDSLMQEMLATTTFINDLNDQLNTVKTNGKATTVKFDERVMPMSEYRSNTLARIDSLVARLNDTQARLKQSQARLHALTGQDKDMSAKVAELDSMISEYTHVIDQQKEQIATLTAQVDSLHVTNAQLATEKAQLTTQVTDLTNFANRVYYIIGTQKELIAKGVASQAGGARFLGVGWKAGKTLVPNRDLQESVFTPLSKPTDVEIALPKPDKKYALVSPQNVKYVEPAPAKDGTFQGKIKITNPDAFWAASKYLILVEK